MTNHSTATDMDHTAPTTGDTERSAMDNPTAPRRRAAGRRLMAAAAMVGAAALVASAAAWACTLRNDVTLKVFNKNLYATCATAGPTGAACSKAIGNGAQTGLATVDTAGDVLSIAGSGFTDATGDLSYSITWRHPVSGVGGNCHRTNPDGSIVLMGGSATVTTGTGVLDVTRTAVSTVGRVPETGLVRICVQDYEFGDTGTATPTQTVVVGQIVDISVV